MSEQAKELWESFLDDMFEPGIEAFHESVYEDGKVAHLILFAWMLGYQESAELTSESQNEIEGQLSLYIAECKAEAESES
jgi:hypothetical protein